MNKRYPNTNAVNIHPSITQNALLIGLLKA